MTILNDLKNFLIDEKIISSEKIAFNFDDYKFGDEKLVLLCKGGEFSDIARKTTVSVIAKNKAMKEAELLINKVFDTFCPPKQYQKPVSVNGKLMLFIPLQPPFYKEKEKDGRHVFLFDLKIVQKK